MAKEIATEPSLPAEEWDFRAINENQLYAAIHYEYARSCDWVHEVFAKWHRTQVPRKHSGLSQWAGMTVHELLVESRANELPSPLSWRLRCGVRCSRMGSHCRNW